MRAHSDAISVSRSRRSDLLPRLEHKRIYMDESDFRRDPPC